MTDIKGGTRFASSCRGLGGRRVPGKTNVTRPCIGRVGSVRISSNLQRHLEVTFLRRRILGAFPWHHNIHSDCHAAFALTGAASLQTPAPSSVFCTSEFPQIDQKVHSFHSYPLSVGALAGRTKQKSPPPRHCPDRHTKESAREGSVASRPCWLDSAPPCTPVPHLEETRRKWRRSDLALRASLRRFQGVKAWGGGAIAPPRASWAA